MWLGAGPYAARAQTAGARIETTDGSLIGLVAADHRLFQGIPYAGPPVGDLRWTSPQPVVPWTEPRDATRPGNRCPQAPDPSTGGDAGDEDCLTLNVTVPHSATQGAPKPVMVWLHGAGAGSGAGHDFDARRLAVGGDVVVVTVNYRLGVFGFFGYPGLSGSGGYGLEDQQAALRWVQRNAEAFGGDPGNVTLFGESSGGMNTCAHLTSPTASGLFHRAIIQSGSCLTRFLPNSLFPGVPDTWTSIWSTPREVAGLGVALAEALGCGGSANALACLRSATATEIMQQPLAGAFGRAAFGNAVLPVNPEQALRSARFHHVPILAGATRDEATFFVAGFSDSPIDEDSYQEMLTVAFGGDADEVARVYPVTEQRSPSLAWAAVVTDRSWVCPTLAANRLLAQHVPVFAYEFADVGAPLFFAAPDFPMGAYHGSELAYLYDILDWNPAFSADQERLADRMIQYWGRFAHSGDPNGAGLPPWLPFRNGEIVPFVLSLAPEPAGISEVDVASEHECAFWERLTAA